MARQRRSVRVTAAAAVMACVLTGLAPAGWTQEPVLLPTDPARLSDLVLDTLLLEPDPDFAVALVEAALTALPEQRPAPAGDPEAPDPAASLALAVLLALPADMATAAAPGLLAAVLGPELVPGSLLAERFAEILGTSAAALHVAVLARAAPRGTATAGPVALDEAVPPEPAGLMASPDRMLLLLELAAPPPPPADPPVAVPPDPAPPVAAAFPVLDRDGDIGAQWRAFHAAVLAQAPATPLETIHALWYAAWETQTGGPAPGGDASSIQTDDDAGALTPPPGGPEPSASPS